MHININITRIFCCDKKEHRISSYETPLTEIRHFLSFSLLTKKLWISVLPNWCSFSLLSFQLEKQLRLLLVLNEINVPGRYF